jgi:multiple sugar transport system substrate-binding protein
MSCRERRVELDEFGDRRTSKLSCRREQFLLGLGKTVLAASAAPLFAARDWTQAMPLGPGRGGDPIATMAVEAAKQFRSIKLAKTQERGIRALDDTHFTAPLWGKLTGIDVDLIEAQPPELYSKAIREHVARSRAFDVLEVWPAWIPELADRGVILPVDALIKKYRAQASLLDYHPLYRSLMSYRGKTWGFYDDGDIWTLYYRKDVFRDPRLMKAYKATFKRDLRVPRTWDEFSETAHFITDQLAPRLYGTCMGRARGDPGNQFYFYLHFQANGGQLFERRAMKALINNAIGVRTMNQILAQNRASIPGVEKLDFVSSWVHWLQGRTAMMMNWPATGRISENVPQRSTAFAFLPRSKIVGKVGYAVGPRPALVPGGGSYLKCVSADSRNREAAYLFIQWATSPSVSLRRLQLPYSLSDPYRISHYRSRQLRDGWPAATEYLRTLCEAANYGVLDPMITGASEYADALDRGMSAIYRGKDVQKGLDDVAREWNTITRRLGVDKQRRSYLDFLELLGSTPKNTIASRGLSVEC